MILVIVSIIVILRIFVFNSYVVTSGSMEDTLSVSDFVIGNRVAYINSYPSRGDIITFNKDGETLVKRVIAVSGDTIDISDGSVILNGQKLEESYVSGATDIPNDNNIYYPYTIKEGEVWVMGDNRENSKDSRMYGAIDISDVTSKVVFRYFPLTRVDFVGEYYASE